MSTAFRLLVVDDEESNRDMLSRRLVRNGYDVAVSASGTECLETLGREPIDLLLLDIQMPQVSGLEVLREVRTRFNSSQLPVIMLTAKDQSEDVVEALDLGANDYLTKPIDLAVLLARIRTQTERRQAERHAELVATNERLMAANAELAIAKQRAEDSSRVKSEFLANMSHELRTPMNGVIGMTELTLQSVLTGEQREYLGIVKSSAESLMTIIDAVLDFSAIDAGRLDLAPSVFNLRDELLGVLKTLADSAYQKGLDLVCDVPPEIPEWFVSDPNRLRQILLHVVGNAVKFTDEGKVVVRVGYEPQDGDAAMLRFSVIDTGIGVPADKQHVIFEAFSQADTSATRQFGGTGLGLTISLRLARLMGGNLWMESPGGPGSCFHFTVCVTRALAPPPANVGGPSAVLEQLRDGGAAARHARDQALATLAPPPGPVDRALRILVAEDNPVNQFVAVALLRKWGHTVVVAGDGRDVLAELARAPVDLILMDVSLPEPDGFITTAAIRAQRDDDGRRVPIVAVSAHPMTGDRERCLAAGMDDYVTKPLKSDDLFAAISRVLARGSAEGVPASR